MRIGGTNQVRVAAAAIVLLLTLVLGGVPASACNGHYKAPAVAQASLPPSLVHQLLQCLPDPK